MTVHKVVSTRMVYENAPTQRHHRQWALVSQHPPTPAAGPKTDLRDVIDAILYILRTGCQWRYLPKDFPPKTPSGGARRMAAEAPWT